jgi:hypothetical protein
MLNYSIVPLIVQNADAGYTRAKRTGNVEDSSPTTTEHPHPKDGHTSTIITDTFIEEWAYTGGVWVKTAVTYFSGTPSGVYTRIKRSGAVENKAPTATEHPTPKDKDISTIITDTFLEEWKYTTLWTRTAITELSPPQPLYSRVYRANTTEDTAPTATEHPTPKDKDTSTLFLNGEIKEEWKYTTVWTKTKTTTITVGGVYKGDYHTVATMPSGKAKDWCILTHVDGVNETGIYSTDGTTYTKVIDINLLEVRLQALRESGIHHNWTSGEITYLNNLLSISDRVWIPCTFNGVMSNWSVDAITDLTVAPNKMVYFDASETEILGQANKQVAQTALHVGNVGTTIIQNNMIPIGRSFADGSFKLYGGQTSSIVEDFDDASEWKQNYEYEAKEVFSFKSTIDNAVDKSGNEIRKDITLLGLYPTDTTSSTTLDSAELAKIELVNPRKKTEYTTVDITTLKDVIPIEGVPIQVLSDLPKFSFYVYNASTTTGIESNVAGFTGHWNRYTEVQGVPTWINQDVTPNSDPQKFAIWKGNDIAKAIASYSYQVVDCPNDVKIDDYTTGKPSDYSLLFTPNDVTTFTWDGGTKYIDGRNYVSGELIISRQQALLVYSSGDKVKIINNHNVGTKMIDTADEVYEAVWTDEFLPIKMTNATKREVAFKLFGNGMVIVENKGALDILVYGYVTSDHTHNNQEPNEPTEWILKPTEVLLFSAKFGHVTYALLREYKIESMNFSVVLDSDTVTDDKKLIIDTNGATPVLKALVGGVETALTPAVTGSGKLDNSISTIMVFMNGVAIPRTRYTLLSKDKCTIDLSNAQWGNTISQDTEFSVERG